MVKSHFLVIVIVVSIFFGGDVFAGVGFSPAGFLEGDKGLQEKIVFPSWDGDVTHVLRCDAEISKLGRVLLNVCFSENDEYKVFERATLIAGKGLRLRPAVVNGKKKKVWFQYIVLFKRSGVAEYIEVYPNYGLEMEKYGKSYSSPQRYKDNVRNYFRGCDTRTNVWIKAVIDESGKVGDVDIVGAKGRKRCKRNILKSFPLADFIPAYSNGKAVSAIYTESFFSYSELFN